MRRFRTIRQRSRRARAGQVAAVATVFGLLLVVSFLSTFVLESLPGQMAALEDQHILQVENQLARLQATILAEANNPSISMSLASPVTLGSQAQPPFGAPSQGTIQPEGVGVKTLTKYFVSKVAYSPPAWNFGSNCLTNGSGKCSSNGNIDTWNVTDANNSHFTLTVNGNSNSVAYNITGNNDTITIDWTGGDTGFVRFTINGSNDQVIYNKGGSDSTFPIAQFFYFGQNDTFSFNPAGSHAVKGGMTLFIEFVGSLGRICPEANLSSSDRVGSLASGGSNLNMTVVWWNSVGYVSGPHTVTYPGGSGANETLTWLNQTGVVACAFSAVASSTYTTQYQSGIDVHLLNRYAPVTDVAYDQGAVILDQQGGLPIMVSPPSITWKTNPNGLTAAVTLVNLIGNYSASGGITTSAVLTRVLAVASFSIVNGQTAFYLTSPLYLNVTTPYPSAWMNYFATLPKIFPYGATCQSSVPLTAPYTCADPPPGAIVTVSARLIVNVLTVTTVSVEVSLA